MYKTRRCNEARFLLASPQTSFGIADERTPKDVCRVKKNSDDDSRTGRRLWWSLLHWWSKTLLFCSVLYSSGRSQSKFFNIQLCSFEKLWRPTLFWTWKEFPPWNFNQLRRSRNWKWLVILFVCLCLFVFIKRAWKMFSVICIFFNKESMVWKKTYSFVLPSCNGKSLMGPELSCFCGAILSTCGGIH